MFNQQLRKYNIKLKEYPKGKVTISTNQFDLIKKQLLPSMWNHKHSSPSFKPVDQVKLDIPVSV